MSFTEDVKKITRPLKPPPLNPPWNYSSVKPPPKIPLVVWDGKSLQVGIWHPDLGHGGDFGTLVRHGSGSITISQIEGVKSWMIVPDQY